MRADFIPSKVEESLDIIFDTADCHSRTITAAWPFFFAALELEHHALKRGVEKPMALGLEFRL
jgi:hypothetical protein